MHALRIKISTQNVWKLSNHGPTIKKRETGFWVVEIKMTSSMYSCAIWWYISHGQTKKSIVSHYALQFILWCHKIHFLWALYYMPSQEICDLEGTTLHFAFYLKNLPWRYNLKWEIWSHMNVNVHFWVNTLNCKN